MLELKLFGAGQATYDDRPLAGFPSRQPCLLLCYLALNRQQLHPREQLAAVFWGSYPTAVSLKHLRNALWRVRCLLESVGAPPDNYVVTRDYSVGFVRSSRHYLDVEAFETATSRYQYLSGRELAKKQAAELETAAELYTGDLLTGIYEDWCLCERERLNLLYLSTLSKLMDHCEARGLYEQALAHGARILAFDNTREAVHRQMMRLYWLLGDRHAAVVQYKRCAQILRETLDVTPMEATMRLYQKILREPSPVAYAPAARGTLFTTGCEDESTQLLLGQALSSVERLRVSVDDAATELRRITHLMNSVRSRHQDAKTPLERRSKDAA